MKLSTIRKKLQIIAENEKQNKSIILELNNEAHEQIKNSMIKQKIFAKKLGISAPNFSKKIGEKRLSTSDIELIVSILEKFEI